MNRKFNYAALLLILLLSRPYAIFPQTESSNEKTTASQKVGMKTMVVIDNNRTNWRGTAPKSLTALVWYPTDDNAKQETLLGPFVKVPVVEGAKISSKQKKYPLILLSHGAGGSGV